MENIIHLKDLKPDPKNARRHNPRNIGMIENSLRLVGAARSGVVDEDLTILAGNGTAEALAAAGIERVKVVQADGNEWVVVQRNGLTPEQKRVLAVSDNRAAELAAWDGPTLEEQGIDLQPWFSTEELQRTKKPSEFGLQDIELGGQSAGPVGTETKIGLIVPPEDYEVARKAVLQLIEGHPTWDVRFPK